MKRIVLYSLLIAILVTLAVPTVNTAFAQGVNASLTVTKTGTPLTQSAPGTITWNVTVTNTGDVTLTGINVTDSRHGALGSIGSLAPGSGGFFTIVESDLPSGTYTDQAFAAGWYGPENLTVIAFSDLIECIVTPPNPAIELEKSANATTIHSGDDVQYTFNVTNTGDTTLYNVTVVDDTFDFILNPVIGPITLAPGESSVQTINVTIAGAGTLTNIANATGYTQNGTRVTDSDTVTVTIIIPDIALEKTVSADTVLCSTTVTYTYNVTNTGTTTLSNVSLIDSELGTLYTGHTLAPGEFKVTTVDVVITSNITNTATASGFDVLGLEVNATDTAFVQVIHPAITVTKTGDPRHQLAPGTITWNVTVTNTGDVPLTGINVTDTRHGYLGSAGTLTPGQTIFFEIVETELPPGFYCDTATAVGAYAGDIVHDGDDATCVILPECITKLIPDVDVDIECLPDGIAAEINVTFMNSTHLTVSALKSGSCIDYTVTYDAETGFNHVSDSIDSHDLPQTQLQLTDAECSTSWSEPPPSETPTCQDDISDNVDSDSVASYSSTWSAPPLSVQQQSTLLDENCRVEDISPSSDIGEFGIIQGALLALLITPGTSPWWATALLSIQRSIKKYMT